jgi:hypothetical protein
MSTTARSQTLSLRLNTVIRLITDEYNRRTLKKAKQGGKTRHSPPMPTSRRSRRRTCECFNCRKRGHIRADCWAKGGGKEGQGPKRKGQDGAASADQQSQQQQPDFEAWAVIEEDLKKKQSQSKSFASEPRTRASSTTRARPATCHHSVNSSSPTARYHRAL